MINKLTEKIKKTHAPIVRRFRPNAFLCAKTGTGRLHLQNMEKP